MDLDRLHQPEDDMTFLAFAGGVVLGWLACDRDWLGQAWAWVLGKLHV